MAAVKCLHFLLIFCLVILTSYFRCDIIGCKGTDVAAFAAAFPTLYGL